MTQASFSYAGHTVVVTGPHADKIAAQIADPVPAIAARKLDQLLCEGFRINGLAIRRDGATPKQGFVTDHGMVGWWDPERIKTPQAPDRALDRAQKSARPQLPRVRLPWADWAFWPWLRYKISWHGWRAQMVENEQYQQQANWKLHQCPDGHQCRATIPGGCATAWCAHFEVKPDETFVPRFPRGRFLPPWRRQPILEQDERKA